MEIKAMNVVQKEYVDDEDFFLSCEVFIGPPNEAYVYEVYDFNIISLKKLCRDLQSPEIMLNRGWMIAKNYDEVEIRRKIESIINMCNTNDEEETYKKIGLYLRMQES